MIHLLHCGCNSATQHWWHTKFIITLFQKGLPLKLTSKSQLSISNLNFSNPPFFFTSRTFKRVLQIYHHLENLICIQWMSEQNNNDNETEVHTSICSTNSFSRWTKHRVQSAQKWPSPHDTGMIHNLDTAKIIHISILSGWTNGGQWELGTIERIPRNSYLMKKVMVTGCQIRDFMTDPTF